MGYQVVKNPKAADNLDQHQFINLLTLADVMIHTVLLMTNKP